MIKALVLLSLFIGLDENPMGLNGQVRWLEKEANRIIRASKRMMEDGAAAFPPQVGIGYSAFWLRDYAYTLEGAANAYTNKELKDACSLFVHSMGKKGCGVDCVKFNGQAVYKPGYGTMGENPVADGAMFTVSVVWQTHQRLKDLNYLKEVLDPAIRAMKNAPINPKTRMIHISPDKKWDRCPYGFTDTARLQGDLLFCSLLYVQACRRLGDLLKEAGRMDEAIQWLKEAVATTKSIQKNLWDPEIGLFRAATSKCREHHIWGSAFAVYLGVAQEHQRFVIAGYFKENYSQIVQNGQVRHLPGGVYWEQGCKKDTYQNGAYWATPVGWFVYALDLEDPKLADQAIIDMVEDFKKHGACEWIINEKRKLPNYLASAALPLAGIRAMMERRKSGYQPFFPKQCPEGHHHLKMVPLIYGIPTAGPALQRVKSFKAAFAGTCVSGPDSEKQRLVCQACGYQYRFPSQYWRKGGESPGIFDPPLNKVLSEFKMPHDSRYGYAREVYSDFSTQEALKISLNKPIKNAFSMVEGILKNMGFIPEPVTELSVYDKACLQNTVEGSGILCVKSEGKPIKVTILVLSNRTFIIFEDI